MNQTLRRLLLLLVLAFPLGANAQTAVNAIFNLNNTSPVAPGTQITTGILGNGTIGSGIGGYSITGTGSALTVGNHNPLCSMVKDVSLGGVTYGSALTSQALQMNNGTSGFTYIGSFPSGSATKITISGCMTFGGLTTNTNYMDIISITATGSGGSWFQIGPAHHLQIESVRGSTHFSPTLVTSGNPTLWCSFKIDPTTLFPGVASSGTASAACFNPYPPYTQITCTPVGTGCTAAGTISVDIQNSATWGQMNDLRLGNAEIGTASGVTSFEYMLYDYTNATFPVTPTLSAPWSGIVSPLRATDWTTSGVVGGIPARATICSTLNPGATASQINSAIAACPEGQTVKLNAGTYNVGPITWGDTGSQKNNVTLRGAGANQTFLVATGNMGLPCSVNGTFICMASHDNNFKTSPTNSTTWTAGYLPGTNIITLTAVGNLRIGNPIILDQLDDTCDIGGVIASDSVSSCSPTSPGISGPYSLEGNGGNFPRSGRNQIEVHTVAGCNGSTTPGTLCTGSNVTVTISPALRMPNWRSARTPGAWWSSFPINGTGIEDLSIDVSAVTGTAIQVKNGYNTWAKGIRILNSERAHIQYVYSIHNTMRDTYNFLTQNAATQSYGYDCNVGGENLVENNIFHAIEGPIKEQGCVGDVIGYNYMTNLYYTPSAGWAQAALTDHTAGDAFNLFEGNVGKGHEADVFHGTHHFVTDFRNYYIGKPPVCYASGATYATSTYGACNNNLHAFRIESFSRGFNAVGNVLGATGLGFSYAGAQPNIFELGQGNTSAVTVPDDIITTNTFMRWGNWDSANAANRFVNAEVPSTLTGVQEYFANAIPATQTLPSSFYLASKPSWFGSIVYPLIGPDISSGNIANAGGHANINPAGACFLNVMGGNANGTNGALSFNATTCYAAVGNPPVNTVIPVVSGTALQGQTLSTTNGSWTGDATITFTYQWIRCNSSGTGCADIAGETASTYLLAVADIGGTIRSEVTGHNAAGDVPATSNQTAVVASFSIPARTGGTASIGGTAIIR